MKKILALSLMLFASNAYAMPNELECGGEGGDFPVAYDLEKKVLLLGELFIYPVVIDGDVIGGYFGNQPELIIQLGMFTVNTRTGKFTVASFSEDKSLNIVTGQCN